ncbi:hypothetical protein MY10362_004702 [Beauveria mimosiformis]
MIQSLAGSPLNVELPILDAAGSPAKQICVNTKHRSGSFNDPAKIRELAARVDSTRGDCHQGRLDRRWPATEKDALPPVKRSIFMRAGIPVASQTAVGEGGEAMLKIEAL